MKNHLKFTYLQLNWVLPMRQLKSALAYLNGYGTNISNKNFHQWAKVSHEGGSAQGSYWLGLSYRDGLGVISNSEEAVKYMEIAAERGSSIANIILAYSYALGEMGLDPDRKKAEKYWIVERLRGNDEAVVDQHEFELNNPKKPPKYGFGVGGTRSTCF